MKITTAAEMREIDRATTERFGVPSLTLMENAGTAVAQFILKNFSNADRIAIVCGKGNNGGDGFVVARKLHSAGRVVEVLLLASPSELRGDAATMFERLPVRPIVVQSAQELQAESTRSLGNCDLLVDAILGTGFKPPVKGLFADAIAAMNRGGKPVVAVDIPSGADSDAMTAQSGEGIAQGRRDCHLHGSATGARFWTAHARAGDRCADRIARCGDRIQTQVRSHYGARLGSVACAAAHGQQQGNVRPRADRWRLAWKIRRGGNGGNGRVAGGRGTGDSGDREERATQRCGIRGRVDDRAAGGNRNRRNRVGVGEDR